MCVIPELVITKDEHTALGPKINDIDNGPCYDIEVMAFLGEIKPIS